MGAHRCALRRARADLAVARRGAEPRGSGRHGLRSGGRAGARGCARLPSRLSLRALWRERGRRRTPRALVETAELHEESPRTAAGEWSA